MNVKELYDGFVTDSCIVQAVETDNKEWLDILLQRKSTLLILEPLLDYIDKLERRMAKLEYKYAED